MLNAQTLGKIAVISFRSQSRGGNSIVNNRYAKSNEDSFSDLESIKSLLVEDANDGEVHFEAISIGNKLGRQSSEIILFEAPLSPGTVNTLE